jgi:Mg2+ and Co2+ transporter CorA
VLARGVQSEREKEAALEKAAKEQDIATWVLDHSASEAKKFPAPDLGDNRQVRWLTDKDMLPYGAKRSRILCFEYPKPPDEDSRPPLLSVIEELCTRLAQSRKDCDTRPILFIGHDFGVTIIERALIEGRKNSIAAASPIYRATAGIIFLASPGRDAGEKLELDYFQTKDQRLGHEKAELPYNETADVHFLGHHLDLFRAAVDSLSTARSALTLRCLQSDGKIRSASDKSYVIILKIATEILKSYPLLVSAANGDIETLKALLASGVDANLQNAAGQSALHLAVRKNHKQAVRWLVLKYSADVALQDHNGDSALHLAVRNGSANANIVEMLLQRGADVNLRNRTGMSVLELASHYNVQEPIMQILQHRPLIKGPLEDAVEHGRSPVPPHLSSAIRACHDFRATLAEFYLIDKQEQFVCERPSVYELLYENGPETILEAARGAKVSAKPRCKWYHLPANNVTWVDDLFARIDITKDPLEQDQHEGPTPWSRYMRPQARSFTPVRLRKDRTGRWQCENCTGKNFVLFLPFLHFERRCDQVAINATIKEGPDLEYYLRFEQEDSLKPDEEEEFEEHTASTIDLDTSEPKKVQTHSLHPTLSGRAREDSAGWPGDIFTSASSRGGGSDLPLASEMPLASDAPLCPPSQHDVRLALDDRDLLEDEKMLIKGYLYDEKLFKGDAHNTTPLHVRRTLDQSLYFMLSNTKKRDRDQVVLRSGRREVLARDFHDSDDIESNASEDDEDPDVDEFFYNDEETTPMVMVDQLWLWVIGDTVITSFPQKWLQPNGRREGDVLGRLLDFLRNNKRRQPITSSHELADLIISHCISVFNQPRSRLGLRLHDYFEWAVGHVADREMTLSRRFEKASKEDPSKVDEKRQGDKQLDDLFDIRKEIKLLDETKDIRDELRMILKILNDQALAVTDLVSILRPPEPSPQPQSTQSPPAAGFSPDEMNTGQPHQVITTLTEGTTTAPMRSDVVAIAYKQRHQVIDANIRDFDRMLSHANASYEALNHLLDLKQKHANASEARAARIGADEASKQNSVIMFFTIVTIIFGSLSFVTAFFALNVTAFPKQEDGSTAWQLGHIVGYVVGISFGLSMPFIVVAFTINPLLELSGWKERKGRFKEKASIWWQYMKMPFKFIWHVCKSPKGLKRAFSRRKAQHLPDSYLSAKAKSDVPSRPEQTAPAQSVGSASHKAALSLMTR